MERTDLGKQTRRYRILAALTTHPIQYQVPLWQALARDGRIPFEVWYLTTQGAQRRRDVGFGKEFMWDIPLLEGYSYRILRANEGWQMDQRRPWAVRLCEPLGARVAETGTRIVWAQGWQVAGYWQAIWQAKRAGAQIWMRGESNDLGRRGGRLKEFAKRRVLGALFGRVDEFLCIGSANRRFYRNYGVPAERMHAAPYCVDNARLAAESAALRPRRAAIRRAWGIPENAFCPLFCGKFIPKKRPADLVRAAESLAGRMPGEGAGLHLLFVGSGELGPALRAACSVVHDAESGSFPPVVRPEAPRPPASFVGFLNQSEIAQAYMAADCLVLPSDAGETWGLVVNEAMACGLPCVVSNACGCAEDLVGPLDPELVSPLGDVEHLARALAKIRAGQGPSPAAVRERVSEFELQRTVETVVQLYRQRNAG